MKYGLLLLSLFHLSTGFLRAEVVLITLDRGFTWKAMFDAGFRPILVRDGIDKCRQLNIHLKIRKQEKGEILDLGVGDVEFSLLDEHFLELIVFYGRERRAVTEVEKKSEVFARIFGDAVTRKSVIAWFEIKLSEDYGGRKIDPPEIIREVDDRNATNHAKIGDLSIFYSFQSGIDKTTPMVERFSLAPKSSQRYDSQRLKTKIQPPVGYEHISLEPSIDRSPNEQSRNETLDKSIVPRRPERLRSATGGDSFASDSKKSTPFPWWLILTSIGVVIVALVAWLKNQKSRSSI